MTDFWDWQPKRRRWWVWPVCFTLRHGTGDSYCWCRSIVRFRILGQRG